VARSAKTDKRPQEKRQKQEHELANHYGAIRIGAVAGALEHHRGDKPWRRTNKSPKRKRAD
jgi:hypothetical protein